MSRLYQTPGRSVKKRLPTPFTPLPIENRRQISVVVVGLGLGLEQGIFSGPNPVHVGENQM